MTILHDYFILELDRLFDVKEESGLISLNEAYASNEKRDANIYKRIYGKIVSVPRGYSGLKFDPVDPGYPNPKIYVGHDVISERAREGYPWTRETHYYPGTVESYEFITTEDIGKLVDAKIGDIAYVHPNSLEEENALWKKDNKYYFRIRVDELLCVVRDGQLVAQGGYVLLKPHMEKESELFRGLLQVKSSIEAKPLQGFVYCARPEFCPKGILVFFISDSEWMITIEGQEVYCMKEEQVMCWLEQ
jgi:hypothetical protein